jgi:peptide/nickel transport system permease protein
VADTSTIATATVDSGTVAGGPADAGGKKRRRLGFAFWIPAVWVALVIFGALFADVLPLKDPNAADPCAQYARGTRFDVALGREVPVEYPPGTIRDGIDVSTCTPDSQSNAKPSSLHWLGTDSSARDSFSRLVHGARVAMIAGVVTIGIGLVVGGTIGLLAGFYRGKVETVLMAIVDIMLAFPTLVLALAIVAVLGRGLFNACVAITVVAIPAFARITRANTLTYAEREFVTAARVMGAKNGRIMVREILPNVIFPVVAFALVAIAVAIVAEGSLAFLSLSVKDPQSSWGQMILDGRGVIDDAPHVALIPAGVMFVTVLCFNLLGEQFRQIFNVRDAAL